MNSTVVSSPSGPFGAEERHWAHLRHEDPAKGRHAGEGTGRPRWRRTMLRALRVVGVSRCPLSPCRLPISVQRGIFWWRRTAPGWSRCSTAFKTRGTFTSSWSSCLEVRTDPFVSVRGNQYVECVLKPKFIELRKRCDVSRTDQHVAPNLCLCCQAT